MYIVNDNELPLTIWSLITNQSEKLLHQDPCSLHEALNNPGSGANVKEKAMIRTLSKAGGAGVQISMDNVMWRGQISEPVLL